ncbi:MAG: peptidase and subtilisin kexin sedolisin [Dehalococcoidia bacterium]|nr:peptidase and subtilisin kexin sedolisin [Dehalococcoidia bacterium]
MTALADKGDREDEHDSKQILVKFKGGVAETEKEKVHGKHGGKVLGVIPGIDVQIVEIGEGRSKEKKDGYRKETNIEFAELDYVAYAIATPNDPSFGNQWGMTKIQAPDAWNLTTGSSSVRIAILDTGIDQNHEDLTPKIVSNRNFTSSRTVDDRYGHGTHVAGIAAASTNNSKGVAGAGYNTSLMNVKVLGDNGSGNYSWIASGITWAANNGAKVINMSLGGGSSSSSLETAINYAWSKGVVVVAAAGNSNTSSPSYPGYYSNVIAVAATDRNDVKASFSNYGSWVDIAAPGVDIYSTLPNHNNRIGLKNYGYLSGTSMATPFVAGVAALVAARYPAWTNNDIRNRLLASTDPTTGFSTSLGRVNALKSVQ